MPHLFQSFFQAGFDCASHRRRDRRRLDSIAAQQHDRFVAQDYAAARDQGLSTIRDGLRWHLIEQQPGVHDWSSWLPMLRAARDAGVQVIWDVWHYGTPDGLDIFGDAFVERIAAFARAAAELHRAETDAVPFWCPLNEISFFAFIAGDCAEFEPYLSGRGFALKQQLVRAGIAVVRALREVDPRAQIVWCEPGIHVLPRDKSAEAAALAEQRRLSQFEAMDMLTGRAAPELGGGPDMVDVVGINFYPHNQFVYDGGNVPLGHFAWRPFSDLLVEYGLRYGKPLTVSETGAENCARSAWLHYVAGEVEEAILRGAPVEGVCWYPVTDYPGWDDARACPTGLFSFADDEGRRDVHPRLAREFAHQQQRFATLFAGDQP